MTTRPRLRSGFTLIEMLVVMGIIVLIATLGFLFLPNLDRNKGVPNGATQVQGWINLMKQQALRDQKPKGIRLIHDGSGRCTQIQYIEQPDPVAPRGPGIKIMIETRLLAGNRVSVVTLFQDDPANPASPWQEPQPSRYRTWEGVEVGDFLELSDNPKTTALIVGFTDPPLPGPPATPPPLPPGAQLRSQLILDREIEGTEYLPAVYIPPPPPPAQWPQNAIHVQTGFRVIRAPRPLVGEPMLHMHKDVFIDLTACYPCPLALFPPPAVHPSGIVYAGVADPNRPTAFQPPFTFYAPWGPQPIPPLLKQPPPPNPSVDANYIDILFNSQGFVANAPVGKYILVVRHVDRPNDMLLICVYTRTGKITAHNVNDLLPFDPANPATNPYGFTLDGKSPGL